MAVVDPRAEQRLEIDLTSDRWLNPQSESLGTVVTETVDSQRTDFDDGWLAVLALSEGGSASDEVLASRLIEKSVRERSDADSATILKQGFRDANREIFETHAGAESPEGVTLLALLTRGKHASIALAGDHRAYLYRANRMTQLTRDQRVYRARSRRKQDVDRAETTVTTPDAPAGIGVSAKLDSRTPAIFEVDLLTEDRLALVSNGVYTAIDDMELEAIVSSPGMNASSELVRTASSRLPDASHLAAVLAVAPAREPRPEVAAAYRGGTPWMPIVVVVLALVAAVVIAGLLIL